jgi:hypothetical protein
LLGSSEENRTEDNPENALADIASGFSPAPEFSPETEVVDDAPFEKRTRKKRETKKKEAEPGKIAFKIPGRVFLSAHNRLLVGAISLVDGFRKNPMPEEYIAAIGLTEEDFNDPDLIFMAEECAKAMKLDQNPIAVFYGTIGMTFINNYMMLVSLMKRQAKKQNSGASDAPPEVNI